jgi:hypothetical protein
LPYLQVKIQQTGQISIIPQKTLAHENQVVVALARAGTEKEIGTLAIDQRWWRPGQRTRPDVRRAQSLRRSPTKALRQIWVPLRPVEDSVQDQLRMPILGVRAFKPLGERRCF